MWNNREWAARHIKKHKTTPEEAWEVFEKCRNPLLALDQIRFPPYRRYWSIGTTEAGRSLLIVWEQYRGIYNLITAFEPNEEKVELYERKTKKRKH